MITAGTTYAYITTEGTRGKDVTIERIFEGVAYASSETVGDLGPFTMRFNVETGDGLQDYLGTKLITIH